MEPSNNTTTVGGVTFGTSSANSGNTPPTPAETMPFPSGIAEPAPAPAPLQTDPFAAANTTTPETPGATPSATEATSPVATEAASAAPETPATDPLIEALNASIEPSPLPANTSAPQIPVIPVSGTTPTVPASGADLQNLVDAVVEPSSETKDKKKKGNETPEQALKKFTTLSLVAGALAVIFLAVGIFGLVSAMTKSSRIDELEDTVENYEKIVKAVEQSAGIAEGSITAPENVPVYKATTGYIYISEWGIKIKIPENLEKVSYILNQNYRPSICFNAVQKGVQYFPDFANIALNPGHMGCLTRIATTEGSFDAASGLSFGDLIVTYKDYNYFYTGPQDYSNPETDAANLGLEHTAHTIIKNMLTDNVEEYE